MLNRIEKQKEKILLLIFLFLSFLFILGFFPQILFAQNLSVSEETKKVRILEISVPEKITRGETFEGELVVDSLINGTFKVSTNNYCVTVENSLVNIREGINILGLKLISSKECPLGDFEFSLSLTPAGGLNGQT